ncbi:MAG: class II glutamine amidotransferase [Polyangiaceae bacterium]
MRILLRVRRAPAEPLGWGSASTKLARSCCDVAPSTTATKSILTEAAEDIRTDVLIGHVRRASVGALRTENTHPFRYRSWVFAQTGTIGGFENLRERLLASQPEFLRRNVRGETDSECFFYLFLSFLHDAGHLDEGHVAMNHVAAALRASISLVDRLSAEEGFGPNGGNILVTNGESMLAVHRNGTLGYRLLRGKFDVEGLLGEDGIRRARIPSIESTHFTILASDSRRLAERLGARRRAHHRHAVAHRRSPSRAAVKRSAACLTSALWLSAACGPSPARFATSDPNQEPERRRAPGVVVDPTSRLPAASSQGRAESTLLVLRVPPSATVARAVVARFFNALVNESAESLDAVLGDRIVRRSTR